MRLLARTTSIRLTAPKLVRIEGSPKVVASHIELYLAWCAHGDHPVRQFHLEVVQTVTVYKKGSKYMAFFTDFATAMSNYLKDSTTLAVQDVTLVTGTSGAINVNEVWKFRVVVTNNGNLNMTNVKVWIAGTNGATVATVAAGPFSASLLAPAAMSVNAHSNQYSAYFYFKAPAAGTASAVQLISTHVCLYDANLDHILVSHSDHSSPPIGSYSAQVYP